MTQARSVTATFTCTTPLAPVKLSIAAKGSPADVLPGGTDFLVLSWQAASGQVPSQYQLRINGDGPVTLTRNSAEVPPLGNDELVTVSVSAQACSPLLTSPALLGTFSPKAPIASFLIDRNPVPVNTNVTLTDNTSSPQATSWLWLFTGGTDGITTQAAKVQFTTAGTYQVALITSNGAGTSLLPDVQTITVTSAASLAPAPSVSLSRFDPAGDGRLVLGRAELGGEGRTYVLVRNLSVDEEAVAFLRAVDENGRVVVERRLVIPANDEAIYEPAAWSLEGQLRLELVSTTPLTAYLQTKQRAEPQRPRLPGPTEVERR